MIQKIVDNVKSFAVGGDPGTGKYKADVLNAMHEISKAACSSGMMYM